MIEEVDKIAVVSADIEWSDLINWDSIYVRYPKNSEGNLIDVVLIDARNNSLLWSTQGLLAAMDITAPSSGWSLQGRSESPMASRKYCLMPTNLPIFQKASVIGWKTPRKAHSLLSVQCGDYVGEDDIVRFDDVYGR